MTKPEAAAPLPEPLEVYMETEDGRLRDAAYLRIVAEKVRSKVGVIMTWEIPSVVAQTLEGIAKRIEASACAAQPPEPQLTCRYCHEPLFADGEGGWSCVKRDRHRSAETPESAPTPIFCDQCRQDLRALVQQIDKEQQDDDFPDAVIRAGLQAQADALAPELTELRTQLAVSAAERAGEADAYRIQGEELLRHIRLAEDAEAKLAALEPYLQHKRYCGFDLMKCTCGLDALRLSGQQL